MENVQRFPDLSASNAGENTMSKPPNPLDITGMLRAPNRGDGEILDQILPLVYEELRKQAHNFLRRERKDHTLQTTALIHEAYVKLVDQKNANWNDRAHFFAISSSIMRRILIDYAKTKHRRKRGGHEEHITLNEAVLAAKDGRTIDLIALDSALDRLAEMDPQQSRIVEMRYFSGMSTQEIAGVLGISESTVTRDWNVARAWLRFELTR